MAAVCGNCGSELPGRRYHVHLAPEQVAELELCDGCRATFGTVDRVPAVS